MIDLFFIQNKYSGAKKICRRTHQPKRTQIEKNKDLFDLSSNRKYNPNKNHGNRKIHKHRYTLLNRFRRRKFTRKSTGHGLLPKTIRKYQKLGLLNGIAGIALADLLTQPNHTPT